MSLVWAHHLCQDRLPHEHSALYCVSWMKAHGSKAETLNLVDSVISLRICENTGPYGQKDAEVIFLLMISMTSSILGKDPLIQRKENIMLFLTVSIKEITGLSLEKPSLMEDRQNTQKFSTADLYGIASYKALKRFQLVAHCQSK